MEYFMEITMMEENTRLLARVLPLFKGECDVNISSFPLILIHSALSIIIHHLHTNHERLIVLLVFLKYLVEFFLVYREEFVFGCHLHKIIPMDNILWDVFHSILEEEPILVPNIGLSLRFSKVIL